MCDADDSQAEQSASSQVVSTENASNYAEVKVEPEDDTGVSDDISAGLCFEGAKDSAGDGEMETAGEERYGDDQAATDEANQSSENASLRAKLRTLVESGQHFLQCASLVSEEEYERQVNLYKELGDVQIKSFNKDVQRGCPYIIADAPPDLIFHVGDFITLPLELCHTEKLVTYAGYSEEEKRFSFGYKKFGKNLPMRDIFNPVMKKCYELILKYVHKSGKPFHLLKRKPPGFWAVLTIVCNKKKELLVQVEVHVSTNQYKRQSCELEKLKFLNFFTDGPGKDCNVVSLQWKETLGQVASVNHVLFGKEFLIERFGDVNVRVYPDDLLFSKPSGIDLVTKMIRELLNLQECDPKVTVLEIGTGTGIVGMQLSKVCKRVHMMDRKEKGTSEHAEENVKLNGIPNCFVHHDEVIGSIQKVTSTLGDDDKVYAVIHNNADTRRVADEMTCIASIEKIKKVVYLSFDHKVRGVKQVLQLCSAPKDPFVPVKAVPVVIVPCYSDVEVAALLVRQSLLEGNTVKNELRVITSTVASNKNRDNEDRGNDDGLEPPNKKKKVWKQQLGDKKMNRQKIKKGKPRPRVESWHGGNRWLGGDRWQGDEEELQDGGEVQEMSIRKVGFPGYRPPPLLGTVIQNPKLSNRQNFQENEKWPSWQGYNQQWGQPQHMNRGFQQGPQNYGNWHQQHGRYQDMDYDDLDDGDDGGYQDNWRGYQQYNNSQQHFNSDGDHRMFNSGSHHQQFDGRRQRFGHHQRQQSNNNHHFGGSQPLFGSPHNQQFNNSQNHFSSSQSQQYDDSENQFQYGSKKEQYGFRKERYGSRKEHYGSQKEQYGPQKEKYGSQKEQYGSLKEQYGSQKDLYGSQKDLYGSQKDQYGSQKDQYSSQKDQYGSQKDQYGSQKDQYGSQKEQYGSQKEQYGSQKDQYGSQKDQYSSQRDQYGSQRNQYGSHRDQYGSQREHHYGSQKEQYVSQKELYGSQKEQQYDSQKDEQYGTQNQQQYGTQSQQPYGIQSQQAYSIQNQQAYAMQNQQQYGIQSQQQYSAQNQQAYAIQNQQQYGVQNQQQYGTQNQQQYSVQNQQQYGTQSQPQYGNQNQQQYSTQNQQQYGAQNQQYIAQNQQYMSQNQQYGSQNQLYNTQNQQYNFSQNQQLSSAQQFNSPLQMNYSTSLKPNDQQTDYDAQASLSTSQGSYNMAGKSTGQQVPYDASVKPPIPQVNYVAPVKSSDTQLSYDASDKSGAPARRFLTYGLDYSSLQQQVQTTQQPPLPQTQQPPPPLPSQPQAQPQAQGQAQPQAQTYSTSGWTGQHSMTYAYGYADSGASMMSGFGASGTAATAGLDQQSSWAAYMPQEKQSTADTNPK